MKKIFILIFLIIFSKFSYSQVYGYFNAKKIKNGFIVGGEFIDKKTKKALNPESFVFEWIFSLVRSIPEESLTKNIFYLYTKDPNLESPGSIVVRILDSDRKEKYEVTNEAQIIVPIVKIVKKINGLIFPVDAPLPNKNISFSVIAKNFSPYNLIYYWTFNNVFISNKKEVSLDELPQKNGLLEIKVTNQNGESASDSLYLYLPE